MAYIDFNFLQINHMKRFLFIFTLLFAIMQVTAQNTLTIHLKDGQKCSFGFDEKPVVTFTDSEIVVTSSGAEVRCQMSAIDKVTFNDKATAVEQIKKDVQNASITLDEYIVYLTGAKPDITVRLVASDGKVLQSFTTDSEGSVEFSIADLPEGVYIVSAQSINIKILKK